MRREYLPLVTLLAVSVSTPALAELPTPGATPDTVVARLMSFDRNGDGRIVVGELPERMQSLLARGDRSNDGALDRAEVRQLAEAPAQLPIRDGFQLGFYGLGDTSFDTSQHFEEVLDDLRLAADTRERAIDIARRFRDDLDTNAREKVLTVMGRLLSAEQLEDFRGTVGGRMVTVTGIRRDGVTILGATAEEAAGQERVTLRLREDASGDPERYLEKYQLVGDRQQQALAAIRQFKLHRPGRLNDTERLELLEQFRGVLTDEQRDDLRAALGRRPLLKLASGPALASDVILLRR